MERAGRRKYSAPRLLSASGEEAARRAMPTRSAARSGGVGAWRSISRWHGTGGKRGKDSCAVGVDSSERVKARGSGGGPLHACQIAPYIRLLFACQAIFALDSPLTQAVLPYPLRDPNHAEPFLAPAAILILRAKGRKVANVGILIIEDDAPSQAALSQVLGAEGWLVEGATSISQA